MNTNGLAPHTGEIIEKISRLDCIKPFVLVGGTALSIQLQTRQSEDLDFQRWKLSKDDTLYIGWPTIQRELAHVGEVQHTDVMGFDQATFIVSGVKLSEYLAMSRKVAIFATEINIRT